MSSIKTAIKIIKNRERQIAKQRDLLDKEIAELEGLRDSCDRAADAMFEAREALSELV